MMVKVALELACSECLFPLPIHIPPNATFLSSITCDWDSGPFTTYVSGDLVSLHHKIKKTVLKFAWRDWRKPEENIRCPVLDYDPVTPEYKIWDSSVSLRTGLPGFNSLLFIIIIIIIIIIINCKWVFTRWQWYNNKTTDK
jgi:hypothetical protein